MNKNKGDLEASRMPLWGSICNLFRKYFKFIATFLIIVLIVCAGFLTMKVTALQTDNDAHVADKQVLVQSNQKLEKEKQVLQDNVIRLESEVQASSKTIDEYEEKLENYESQKQEAAKKNTSSYSAKKASSYSTSWGSMKSYMSYKAITNTRSKQYQLQQKAVTDSATGIRTVDGYYCIAMGTGWGCAIGDKVTVTLQGGKTFKGIVADFKSNAHTNSDNKTTTHDGSVVEFVVDTPSLPNFVRSSGNVGTLDQFSGGVVSITKE